MLMTTESQPKSFRSAFLPPFVVTLGIGILLAVAYMANNESRSPYAVNWVRLGYHMIEYICFLTFWIVFGVIFFTVQVSEAGLRSYNIGGAYYTFAWEEIDRVEPFNLLGLRYLLVGNHATSLTLWVPLYLSDKRGFKEEITRLAGANHPFVEAWKG